MPDKWEYPWYAAWDLAFHTTSLAIVDLEFAKHQLELMLRELYLHPNGQIPAYEWNFGDVNPPVHAWATLYVYPEERPRRGKGDIDFLKRSFHKLMLNFTWWVNRKDPGGRNVFEGGFLGLDNIGVFDRSSPLPTGGYRSRPTARRGWRCSASICCGSRSSWRADEPLYEELVDKFFQAVHRSLRARPRGRPARRDVGRGGRFFYDLLRLPDGSATRLKVRSMVGLLPLAGMANRRGTPASTGCRTAASAPPGVSAGATRS
ncbi:MAG: hypothetical protein IPF60_20605 [Betaproteobacteria bacterium]|nr:hypothetical protein [Betaproteobacteria bacterium]